MNLATMPHIVVAHPIPLLRIGIAETLRASGHYQVTLADSFAVSQHADLLITNEQGFAECSGDLPVLVVDQPPRDSEINVLLRRGVKGYLLQTCPADELYRATAYLLRGGSYMYPQLLSRMLQLPSLRLTRRETDVLHVLALGHGNKAIARRLEIAEDTVKTHMKRLMSKLGAASRTQALALAAQRGLVDIDGSVAS